MSYSLSHLEELEAESIHIIREFASQFKNPVMLYSIGKDSSVMLKLAQKAFHPAPIPFPLLHINTGYKFKEMIEFRDYYCKKINVKLIEHSNKEEIALQMNPEEAHTPEYIYYKKTKPLLEALKKYNFDAALGGARRDEEKSRAKERIFSFRNQNSSWEAKSQRPELWHLYNCQLNQGDSMRVFPLSNWTEADIWNYILEEEIEIVPLYFSKKRKVIKRNGMILSIDDYVVPQAGEEVFEIHCRYRTLGCSPSTGAVESTASTLEEIVYEVLKAKNSERNNRAIDQTSDASMEKKKQEGYF